MRCVRRPYAAAHDLLLPIALIALAWQHLHTPAQASSSWSIIFFEDFDYVTLGPVNSTFASHLSLSGDVVSSDPPPGWLVDNSGFGPLACESFRGWRFWNYDTWRNDIGNGRGFGGRGTIAVFDSDQANECGAVTSEDAVLRTPDIQLSQQLVPDTLRLSSHYSFYPKGDMQIQIYAYVDGVRQILLSTRSLSPDNNAYFGFPVDNPPGAKSVSFEFVVRSASNDWWWAVDNIVVTGVLEERLETLLEEDFDSLSGDLASVDIVGFTIGITGSVVTSNPPSGWAVDTPDFGSTGDCNSFNGWKFWSLADWEDVTTTAGRADFSDGSNIVAVVEAEFFFDNCISTAPMHTVLVSPAISLSTIQQGDSVQVAFDSSFRKSDTMVLELLVFYDGNFTAPAQTLLSARNPGPDRDGHASERLSFAVNNPVGATNMTLHWVAREVGDDRWWVIDNIVVKGGPPPFRPKQGATLLYENFEYVSLGAVSSTHSPHSAITGDVVTADPPHDWQVDNSNFAATGCESFRGWRFWDLDSWSTELAGGRDEFGGKGTIAVFDSEQATLCGITEAMHTILRTPEIRLSRQLVPNSLVLWFESLLVISNGMTVEVIAHIDGVSNTLVSTTVSGPEHQGSVFLEIDNTAGAETLSIEFIAFDADVDKYWAIDGVLITGEFEPREDTLLFEDFESLAGSLAPVVSNYTAHDTFSGNAVTGTPPAGWTLDNSNYGASSGCDSFDGWRFWDLMQWMSELMDDRQYFVSGRGVAALVDSDQYDNCGSTELMHTILISPTIDLTLVKPYTTQVEFDSSFFASGDMVIEVLAFFDADFSAPAATLLSTRNPGTRTWNERMRYALDNPPGATNLTLHWVVREANDNWWWVIDNIAVKGHIQPLLQCTNPEICSSCQCGRGIRKRIRERIREAR